jgi:Zn-dependent M28 family amino/carboxypeptidase
VRYHNWTTNETSGSNIEGTLYGKNRTGIFIICGHYDCVAEGPGADDDGSGVAVALAAAKIMSEYSFNFTIRFIAFSGEEQGLLGSYAYAEEAYNKHESIIAVLNADMIGFTWIGSDGKKGNIFENEASKWIVNFTIAVSQLYYDYIGITLTRLGGSGGSDHYSFWQFQYDAVFYHEYISNYYYHTADDTIEHMNITYTTRYSRLILSTLTELVLHQQVRTTLKISDITGGGTSVTAEMTNSGDANATNVNWTLSVTGGIFGGIRQSSSQHIPIMTPQAVSRTTVPHVFGLGSVDIIATAEATNANPVTKRATGLVFGPFIIKITMTK